jgi:flagellar basal body-associated protein FliL
MSILTFRSARSDSLSVGGIPRAHLLPPEIALNMQARARRGRLLRALVAVVVLVVLGLSGAIFLLVSTNESLAAEQVRANSVVVQSSRYSAVIRYHRQMADIVAVEPAATTGEISWQSFITSVQATLPAGMVITTLSASLDAPANQTAAATNVGQAAHIGTIKISADATTMAISDWLDRLRTLTGFVDATPGAVSRDASTGHFIVQVSLHVNSEALSGRFQTKK